MVFAPNVATVEEAIFDNLVSTLQAIAPPSYNTTVNVVKDCEGLVEEVPDLPAIVAYHGGTRSSESRPSCELKIMTIFLALGLSSGSDDPRQDAMRFTADVEYALTSTLNRGGNARNTVIRDTEIVPRTREDAIQSAVMTVEVVFAHLFADPTTSL